MRGEVATGAGLEPANQAFALVIRLAVGRLTNWAHPVMFDYREYNSPDPS